MNNNTDNSFRDNNSSDENENYMIPITMPDMSQITTAIREIKSGKRQVDSDIRNGHGGRAYEVHDKYDKLDKSKYVNVLIKILESLANLNGIEFDELLEHHVFGDRVPLRQHSKQIISRA